MYMISQKEQKMQKQSMLLEEGEENIYWLAGLEHSYISCLSAGLLVAGQHICLLAHLEHGYILWLSAGPLVAGSHICRLECLEHGYIL